VLCRYNSVKMSKYNHRMVEIYDGLKTKTWITLPMLLFEHCLSAQCIVVDIVPLNTGTIWAILNLSGTTPVLKEQLYKISNGSDILKYKIFSSFVGILKDHLFLIYWVCNFQLNPICIDWWEKKASWYWTIHVFKGWDTIRTNWVNNSWTNWKKVFFKYFSNCFSICDFDIILNNFCICEADIYAIANVPWPYRILPYRMLTHSHSATSLYNLSQSAISLHQLFTSCLHLTYERA
jgi:hypothetical protein